MSAPAAEDATYACVGALVDELCRAGVRHACVSPGSRSTPLALCAARHPGLRLWVHLDERSAAYFALGVARASGAPVALICTSGTAAANYLPAVAEAALARVPLVLLTADRPHELRDWGAHQTIDQVRLYGRHVRWFADLIRPEATPAALRYFRAVGCRAVAEAQGPPAGPVHLNVPLREPLVPAPAAGERDPAAADPVALHGRPGGEPYVRACRGWPVPDGPELDALLQRLRAARRGVIVAGPQPDPGLARPLAALAAALGMPVLADPLSGLRCGDHALDAVIDAYDALLRVPAARDRLLPDLVVRVGGLPASRPLQDYLDRARGCPHLFIDPAPGWRDPLHAHGEAVQADPRRLCEALLARLPRGGGSALPAAGAGAAARPAGCESAGSRHGPHAWLALWRRLNRAARQAVARALAAQERPAETRLWAELCGLLPDGCTVFAGNSMPVRDLDTFWPASRRRVRFLANRGASGIDGVVSSALGVAAAGDGPVVLVVGDVSFYHDLGGLLAARRYGLHLTVVLVHNDGGGIFSFLPQARHGEAFEELFGTPHGLDFAPAVAMFGGRHLRADSWPAFRAAVREALAGAGLWVVELRTDRTRNVEDHRAVWEAVSEAVTAELAAAAGSGAAAAAGGAAEPVAAQREGRR